LVLEHLPGTSVVNADEHHTTKQHTAEHQTTEHHTAEQHAAELLAGLHDVTAAAYGFAEDTLIGSLRLPNGWHPDWGQFFADKRLLHFANLAHERGRLPEKTLARIRQLAKQVPSWLEPNPPGLVHGDVWSGNVLAENGLISGILDPALYYADPEVELAYIDLFSTFGNAFWQHYQAHRPISDAFWQYRRALYSLYPLLVHVYYFGSGYLSGVEQRLEVLEQHIG
jgi:fructosamine-3-kinase